MKKIALQLSIACLLGLLIVTVTSAQSSAQTITFPDIQLSTNSTQAGYFPEIWDLTACDMTISFTYDANGLIDDFGPAVHAWADLGVRTIGYGNVLPAPAGIWFATDYESVPGTFDPDPGQDRDDKLLLQKAGGQGEGTYDLPSPPPNPGLNHRFWFDRDGVDPFQAQHPLAVDGGTYNTAGTYNIVMSLTATSATTGEAYLTINGLQQGFEVDGDLNTMELTPAGMSFTGQMAYMQLFYTLITIGGHTQSVEFRDVSVTGCLNDGKDFVTGGGWIATPDDGRANFGLVARYNAGAFSPTGKVQYIAPRTGINFQSTALEWLTVNGDQATFKGIGTLNGENSPTGAPYFFRVWVTDGNPDTFQIRIWYESGGQIEIYNSGPDRPLGGGNIAIHH